ncbi:PSD1 and planctomycete cytochrome C domain-containing protein [Schlesneria paludicola]|uniref:PSD1 and planctomycete cytochrome C domain-containing protein n=1 Tax=Schlesneria paludicola TaxID=360056 RepID=UPI00029A8A82|nr:PSD1 and planctomycete cytochrome C domain-containing protein [Schlesneria paludicola]
MNEVALIVLLSIVCGIQGTAEEVPDNAVGSQADVEFFESSVRPLLVDICGSCHGATKQWAGLRLDSRAHILAGGDSGPAVVPGDLEKSLLISAVRRTGDYQMPPDKPLTAEQVVTLERWVKLGAPWPAASPSDMAKRDPLKTHWAFQPISNPVPPATTNPEWSQTPVDAFILAKLTSVNLAPSSPADRESLIRRVTFDLLGLPPTHGEVEAFVSDTDPKAYEVLVERLLRSTQYGEQWGRKWLDLARYSDTRGYFYGWEMSRYVHAPAYRDWVINAFNTDMPYDRFLLLQIAADQVASDDPSAQLGMGFLTIGRRFLGNDHDIIDDRIDVVGRTTMGLTFGCARCHDHKYDPIPAADYYSLYGIFHNSVEQLTVGPVPPGQLGDAFEKDLRVKQDQLSQAVQQKRDAIETRARANVAGYLVAQLSPEQYPNIPFSQILGPADLFPVYVERWEEYLRREATKKNPLFVPWHRFAALSKDEFESSAESVLHELRQLGSKEVSPLVMELFSTAPKSMKDVAERYGTLLAKINQEWQTLAAANDASKSALPGALPNPEHEAIRQVLYGTGSPFTIPNVYLTAIGPYFTTGELIEIWKFQNELETTLLNSNAAAAFTVRMIDRQPEFFEEPRIFRRGNPLNKGHDVPRQSPKIIAGSNRQPYQRGSGRLELAQQIASPENPLTARVWVNRIWQNHFDSGLVATPSDFGTRATRPEHLELLDWLSRQLIQKGWSTKAIHREIVLSSTYRQNSLGPADRLIRQRAAEIDPDNRLYWRKNPHRLTFEEFRDSLLAVSGDLDPQQGGQGTPLFSEGDTNHRRTLYSFIDREKLSSVYRVFDFANPDLHVPTRSETTVSQQALFEMNHPFVATRARRLAARLESLANLSPEARVEKLFEAVYQRAATPEERAAALQFVASAQLDPLPPPTPEQAAWQYGYGAISEAGDGIRDFKPLPHFNGTAWQGGGQWPDPQLGWVRLTADGGHPGNDLNHAAIRRWTAAKDGILVVECDVRHEPAEGKGIRGSIIANQNKVLEQFTLLTSSRKIQNSAVSVHAGDTLDFVVDFNGALNSNQYLWTVSIRETSATSGTPRGWNSTSDFAGTPLSPPLKPWEQLAQVLLLSNEFRFVD